MKTDVSHTNYTSADLRPIQFLCLQQSLCIHGQQDNKYKNFRNGVEYHTATGAQTTCGITTCDVEVHPLEHILQWKQHAAQANSCSPHTFRGKRCVLPYLHGSLPTAEAQTDSELSLHTYTEMLCITPLPDSQLHVHIPSHTS